VIERSCHTRQRGAAERPDSEADGGDGNATRPPCGDQRAKAVSRPIGVSSELKPLVFLEVATANSCELDPQAADAARNQTSRRRGTCIAYPTPSFRRRRSIRTWSSGAGVLGSDRKRSRPAACYSPAESSAERKQRGPRSPGLALPFTLVSGFALLDSSRVRTSQPQRWTIVCPRRARLVGTWLSTVGPSNRSLGLRGGVWRFCCSFLVIWRSVQERRSDRKLVPAHASLPRFRMLTVRRRSEVR